MFEKLECINCKGILKEEVGKYTCKSCTTGYNIKDSVIDFMPINDFLIKKGIKKRRVKVWNDAQLSFLVRESKVDQLRYIQELKRSPLSLYNCSEIMKGDVLDIGSSAKLK